MRSTLLNTFDTLALATAVCLCLSACGSSGDGTTHIPERSTTHYAYIAASTPESVQTQTPGTVYQYAVGTDGSFTALSVPSITVGPSPQAIVSDPSGHFVYVINADGTISQYSVGGDGELVALSPAIVQTAVPAPADYPPTYAATVAPDGRFLYVAISPQGLPAPESYIAEYAIGTGGQLTALTTAYLTVPIHSAGALAVDASGKHAYLAGGVVGPAQAVGELAQFSVAADGTLAPLQPATITTPAPANGIALNGQNAYLLSRCADSACDGQVIEYTVQSDGSLALPEATTVTGSHVVPVALLTNASGSTVYVLTNLMGVDTNMGAVYQYAIDSAGRLTPDSPASLGVAAGSVTEGILGSDLYVLSSNALGRISGAPPGGHVDHYAIGTDGLLTYVNTTSVAAAGFPTAMTFVAAH